MTNGRFIAGCMAGWLSAIVLYEGWQLIKPLFIALCDAGRGGC